MSCVDVRVAGVVFADWIVGDVGELVGVIRIVADAVLVISGVPDLAAELIANGEGEAAFDPLNGFGRGLGGGDEDVDVIGHDDESVEEEFTCVAVAEESGDEELRICGSLKYAPAVVGEDGDRVGLWLQAHRSLLIGEHTPGAKAPR